MKKIINNKKYDTDTAREIASYSNGGGWQDFSHYAETLYRKKSGEFFLHGQGGPMTRYAVSCGQNEWTGGEKIIPLTYDAAREWAEEHMDADAYEEVFGEVTEDDTKRSITLSVTATTAERLRRESEKSGKPIGVIVDELVAAALK